ncbi:MAG: CC0125/CC1285 family lipoprotein [Caulobacter sp.]
MRRRKRYSAMKTARPLIAAGLAALLLTGCATTPTVYRAAVGAQTEVGYSEYRLETGRYRVTFQGGAGAPEAQVADYALLRAAELALRDGYDWFRIADRSTTMSGGGSGPRLSVGGGSASFGRHSGIGVGLGTSFNLGPGPAYARSIEVVFGKGPTPRDSDAYDAREIVKVVGYGRAEA